MLLILLIVLAVLCFGGGLANENYRGPGISLGAVLLIVLVVVLFTRRA